MHTPVFLTETIEGLAVKQDGLYVDGTYGEGGHARAITDKGGTVLAIDLDSSQVAKVAEDGEITLVQGNYADIQRIAKKNDFYPVDGVLLDFGLSMEQIAKSGRGFSYKNADEPLDMRISVASADTTAADIINSSNREQLYEIFTRNSEEVSAKSISNALKSAGRITKVGDVVRALKGRPESTIRRVFQALRIEVNNEFQNIRQGIEGAYEITKPGGRIAIISFHSLEDRIVKLWSKGKKLKEINKVSNGERSFEKSAVLRVFEKII